MTYITFKTVNNSLGDVKNDSSTRSMQGDVPDPRRLQVVRDDVQVVLVRAHLIPPHIQLHLC